jgi:N-acetylmuramoyl-L-alanine amidase
MRARNISIVWGVVVGLSVSLGIATDASAQSVKTRYEATLSREPEVRRLIESTGPDAPSAARTNVQRRTRQLAATYDAIVRRYPGSGYSDNALTQAGSLYQALFDRYGREEDRKRALEYYQRMLDAYPHSSLVKKTRSAVSTLSTARAARAAEPSVPAKPPAPEEKVAPPPSPVPPAPTPVATTRTAAAAPTNLPRAVLTDVQRTVLPEAVRVTLAFDREVTYREERIVGPARVFFDLPGVSATPELVDAVLDYSSDVVRQIRLGRHPDKTVRVVLDLEGVTRHSVFTLYNPFRIVIDCERPTTLRASAAPAAPTVSTFPADLPAEARSAKVEASRAKAEPPPPPVVRAAVKEEAPLKLARETDLPSASPAVVDVPPTTAAAPVPARETASAPSPPPVTPSANSAGGFSMARQLGLGVSRIVIDPGHGGRDPGVMGRGMSEAPLTLDVALRLEKLLLKETGVEVVLTRRSDVYVPLEERTEIANREGADLFLSIHANASRNADAGGIETYYLSFASSPEAEAVAARENSASERAMHNLPDIIKTIALNNKLDESRDFATMVQESLVGRARRSNKGVRDRGVKKAPFVVLIGANMPSILAEISFLSNRQENQLLRSAAYKDRIAEALHAAVMRYRRALKGQGKIAEQEY